MKTIKQLSQKLNIGPSGVDKRMKKIEGFREKYTKKSRKNHRLLISDKGSQLLVRVYGINHHSKSMNSTDNSLIINELKLRIKSQKKSLHNSYETIKQANKSQSKLEKLLDQQQQLQLATQKENEKLKGNLKKLNGPKMKKRGFWSRIFKK